MSNIDGRALDNWITGNYGNDLYADGVPDDAYCTACGGEGCETCKDTGIDQTRLAEFNAQAKRDADAEYQAWRENEPDDLER
jgi:hypothetical protein